MILILKGEPLGPSLPALGARVLLQQGWQHGEQGEFLRGKNPRTVNAADRVAVDKFLE